MSKNKDSIANIVKVAGLVCLVCALIVSYAAISLRPLQEVNKEREVKKNILAAAGLYDESKSVEEQFQAITTRLVDIESGEYVVDMNPENYDSRAAIRDPRQSEKLAASEDIASIKRQENIAEVYAVEENGKLKTLILPIRGYGLWSTLWGFIALEDDLNTVVGLGFYEHAETPGLGGEIDNPRWKAQWQGKEVYGDGGDVALFIKKGSVDKSIEREADHGIDGLSGATLTSVGVDNLIQFWMGSSGFKTFIQNLKAGEV